LASLLDTLKLNTQLLLNCLDGISDLDLLSRPNEHTNNIGFVALHILDARHYMARMAGLELEKPFEDITDAAHAVDDIASFPPVEKIRLEWKRFSAVLTEYLTEIDESLLLTEIKEPFPVVEQNVLGGITFLLEHESYHIGQLAFLRKFLGFDPMKYDM
jgi:uncharacterized damage-inducible protein DinB